MSEWPAAVLFDFDGVLVNSEPLHFQAFREVLAAEHIALDEDEYYRELIGFDDKGAFRHVYARRSLDLTPKTFLALMARKSGVMMDLIYRKQFSALPGVEEFVRTLWRRCPLAICSGALREEIEAMLEGIALRDCFPIITAAEDVAVGKPDPSGYLQTMHALAQKVGHKLEPKDCLIIEDAPSVIHTVRAVGFPVLAVATSYPVEKLSEANWRVKSLQLNEVRREMPKLKLGA
ncbi:MAG TPA: HAD family phosphatase [Tepidisphaeraceae bacterium]|jgi:HAD superfamily hydrolase (TIGR01509 family)|nr:HAD family phosphatase [Tepidisphaeraceae bacterium]